MTTFRKVPEDIEQVSYIKRLIDADIDARGGQLASEKKWSELNKLTTWQATWAEIEADLKADESPSKPEKPATKSAKKE